MLSPPRRVRLRRKRLRGAKDLASKRNGKNYLNESAGINVVQADFAAELLYTLAHAGNADADAAGAKFDDVFGETLSIVTDGDNDLAIGLLDYDRSFVGA
jgi:hypothetical protein